MITLKTLHKATVQEVFDQVKAHLLAQGKKSMVVDDNGIEKCKYRSGDLKCAAGCLIGDDEYKKEFEGHPWDYLVKKYKISEEHGSLIAILQRTHDYHFVENWPYRLEVIAREYALKP